ncbi:MAG: hypothetical protein WBL44_18885, partial [Nitrososphaeraceae archaeon]
PLAVSQNQTSRLSSSSSSLASNTTTTGDSKAITEIYPTKENGREWYMNMSRPENDSLVSVTFDPNITKNTDGSWHISYPHLRFNVNTPSAVEPWKNVEMTGYVRVVSTNSSLLAPSNTTDNLDDDDEDEVDIAWYARGGRRNSEVPCEGTAYFGGIHPDGIVSWKKSIWWTGGYTDERFGNKIIDSVIGKWIGWKVVMYDIMLGNNNTTAVKLESYLDLNNSGNWTKVTDIIDNGGWYARTPDAEFFGANCDRPKDYVVTNSGPIATFRADYMILDFRDLSIREIQPPSNLSLTNAYKLSGS